MCKGKLVFDQELTTVWGRTEFALYICSSCGYEHRLPVEA